MQNQADFANFVHFFLKCFEDFSADFFFFFLLKMLQMFFILESPFSVV